MHFHKRYHEKKKKKIDVNATEYLETTNIKYLNLLHQKEKAFLIYIDWEKKKCITCCRVIKINALDLHNLQSFC